MASAAQLAAALSGNESICTLPPGTWTVTHTPAVATQATASKAAGTAGVRHVCFGIIASIACGATAQTPLLINLRDGASGAGTVVASFAVSAIANSCSQIFFTEIGIMGTAATAMTLESAAAGVAASQITVTLIGYDVI